jgi:hypothetical protein
MAGGAEAVKDAEIGSALDRLVQAMKKRSALVPVADEIHPETNIKKQLAEAVHAMQEKDPVGNKIIESAVDVLVQAMKLRRTSSMEL